MVRFIVSIPVIMYFCLCLLACSKKEIPAQNNPPVTNTQQPVRKVLLEDYSGHQCGHCPPAAAKAEELYKQYKGDLIVMVVHAGYFTATNPHYPTSYTTTAGEAWNNPSGFGLSNFGNPIGMINRKNYNGTGSLAQSLGTWTATIAQAFEKDPYILGLEIIPDYNISSRTLNTLVKTKFEKGYPNTVKLSLVLTEDSVVGPQADYSKEPDYRIPDFVFMYMMRGAINGTWGDTLKKNSTNQIFATGDALSVTYQNFSVDSKFNDKHLSLVAFVYDALSKEVLQVEKIKIR